MTINPLVRLSRLTFDAPDIETLEASVRELAAPTFAMRQEGHRTDIEGFLGHLRELRGAMSDGEITILDDLTDSSATPVRVAVRSTVTMRMNDGSTIRGESQMIATLDADGRLDAVHEIGRLLGDGDDRPEPTRVG